MKPFATNRTFATAVLLVLAALAIVFNQPWGEGSVAQAQQPKQQDAPGGAKQDRVFDTKTLIDPNDAVILLLDHQNGLFQTVKDVPVADLRTNTVILAKLASLRKCR